MLLGIILYVGFYVYVYRLSNGSLALLARLSVFVPTLVLIIQRITLRLSLPILLAPVTRGFG
jgi:hypothetical protein